MALNRLMHPDNVYKTKQPNFLELALKWPKFAEFVSVDVSNKPKLDYSNPEALRQLTTLLLKEDFQLDVDIPRNRLVPTLPLRLNYLLWLGDIFEKKLGLTGLDIGAGASCVYPLLGSKIFKWKFAAIESDELNWEYAKKNVSNNSMIDEVTVVKVAADTQLESLVEELGTAFDFCMCNPPFYGSMDEHNKARTSRRPKPQGTNTADVVESVTPGGEIEFVKQIIAASCNLKSKIRVYTTMLGKKSSLSPLRKVLVEAGVPRIAHTEFCQGKTMRWGSAWSFDNSVQFPKSTLEQYHATKAAPLRQTFTAATCSLANLSIDDLQSEILKLMDGLGDISMELVRSASNCRVFVFKATAANWTNQRAKRRAAARLAKCQDMAAAAFASATSENNVNAIESECQLSSMNVDQASEVSTLKRQNDEKNWIQNEGSHSGDEDDIEVKRLRCDLENETGDGDSSTLGRTPTPTDGKTAILKCYLMLKLLPDKSVLLELNFIAGENKDSMHQVYQYLKNKLYVRDRSEMTLVGTSIAQASCEASA